MSPASTSENPRAVGRYLLFEEVAHGGMATVHIGRLRGEGGFARTVAIKRLHPHFAKNPEFTTMLVEEAKLAGRLQHPNVVPVLDVVAEAGELFLVMEYVHGESLSNLLRSAREKNDPPSHAVAVQIITNVLSGLHGAHEAKSDRGVPLAIVHRDVSPQNIMVGLEGVARVLDFGIAKAAEKAPTTREDNVRGKMAYMASEQLTTGVVLDRRVDVYAAGVVLWELLAGNTLHDGLGIGLLMTRILLEEAPRLSTIVPDIHPELDAIVAKALSIDRDQRFATAEEMARALEAVIPPIPSRQVGEWASRVVDEKYRLRADLISRVEKLSLPPPPPISTPMDSWPVVPVLAPPPSTPDGAISKTHSLRESWEPPQPRKSRLLLVLVALPFLIVIAIIAVLLVPRGQTPPQPASVASVASAPSASLAVSMATPALSAPPELPASASAPKPVAAPVAPKPIFKPPPAKNCDPPYTVDARGVRTLKRECL